MRICGVATEHDTYFRMKKALGVLSKLERCGAIARPDCFGQKLDHRARLRNLPWPDKVKVVIELQKIAKPILAARGKTVTVWPED